MKCPFHPPGPTSKIPGLLYLSLRRDPLGFLQRAVRRFGDFVHLQIGPRHDCLVNDPEQIKKILLARSGYARSSARALRRLLGQGLLTSDGEYHARQRKTIQPIFQQQQTAWAAVMLDCAARLRDQWQPGAEVDVTEEMMNLARGIIIKVVLALDLEQEDGALLKVLEVVCKATNQNTFPTLAELLSKFPFSSAHRLRKSIRELDLMLYRMIAERRARPTAGSDFLSCLIAARNPDDGAGLTDQQVRDELLTMIVAGHETIGNALSWTWYLLSQNPAAEARLHAEVETVLQGRPPTAEDCPRLTYVGMVFAESLRLYPPVWILPRRPLHGSRVGEYDMPAGSYFQLCPYITQRDARNFPDPERFDPERWTPEQTATRHRFSYFPFASGQHKCIGETFSRSEGILALATLAQKWTLRLVPGHRVVLAPLITLRSKYGMRMTLHPRT